MIDIIGHYGRRYRLIFGADKTQVTVTGSKHDMQYYQDVNIWNLYGKKLTVSEDNEHLGLVVSGMDEEIQNVDKKHSVSKRFSVWFSWECILIQVQAFTNCATTYMVSLCKTCSEVWLSCSTH